MEAFTDFLVSNYLWFLVTSIVLIFALIGYLVDQNEQKKGLSTINKVRQPDLNIEDLAAMAQNKSLNNAVSDAMKSPTVVMEQKNIPYQMPLPTTNTIQDVTQNVDANSTTIGFDVLTK